MGYRKITNKQEYFKYCSKYLKNGLVSLDSLVKVVLVCSKENSKHLPIFKFSMKLLICF